MVDDSASSASSDATALDIVQSTLNLDPAETRAELEYASAALGAAKVAEMSSEQVCRVI